MKVSLNPIGPDPFRKKHTPKLGKMVRMSKIQYSLYLLNYLHFNFGAKAIKQQLNLYL